VAQKTFSSFFQDEYFDRPLFLFLSVDAKFMVSKNCTIIGEHVAVNFMAQSVTKATI